MTDINQQYQIPQYNNDNRKNTLSDCFNSCLIKNKIVFYITIILGCLLYILAIKDFYNSIIGEKLKYINSIFASLLTIFCPIWLQSPYNISFDLKRDFLRVYFIVFILLCLFGLIISYKSDDKSSFYICNSILLLAGIFLALSYTNICKNIERSCDSTCNGFDQFFCCLRHTYFVCDCHCDCGDCGNCGDCGDCGNCGDCGDCGDCIIM